MTSRTLEGEVPVEGRVDRCQTSASPLRPSSTPRYSGHSASASPSAVSGIHGTRTGDLLDLVTRDMEVVNNLVEDTSIDVAINVDIVGHPIVGKSSLLNRVLGQHRAIVSDVPGTTCDSIVELLESSPDRRYNLIDTAGMPQEADLLRHGVLHDRPRL
mmetsp:Transcript_26230/g.65578  ORF Transcript_26230/g.65578 Transcript_26230/m.65578 type:complete len:158 (+) Transcript_26230:862-1335(+)